MKKSIYALALLGTVLLSGCAGTIQGRDTLDKCAGVFTGTTSMFPSVDTDTQVCENLDILLKHALVGEYQQAFDMLVIEDTTFVTLDNFSSWFQKSGIIDGYTLTEDKRDKTKLVNVSSATASYDFYPEKQEDGSWKYRVNELCAQDFVITCPAGIPISLDGIDLAAYATGTTGDITTYTIPQILDAPHSIEIDTYFTDPQTINIANCSTPVDISKHLAVPKKQRTQFIKNLASPMLAQMNKVVIEQDWDKFCALFTPDKNMQEYQQHFYKGSVKTNVYDLKLLETRDLELSDLDVHFTGYNTVSVKFGTKWSWSAPEDVKYDKDGKVISINESRIKIMRIVNTLELYFDAEANKWYLDDIDTNSIMLLSPGEEQWR